VKRTLAALGCVLVFATAHAAPAATTTYDVEVLVFENRLPSLEGGELWTRDNAQATKPDAGESVTVGESFPADASFVSTAAALDRNGGYRVLLHRRWRQTAEEKSATKAVRLRNAEGKLDGTLRFYTSRFLLVDLDVVLQDKGEGVSNLNYRLSDHRRVKPQEINYFDHPKLGVLLKVTPVAKEDDGGGK